MRKLCLPNIFSIIVGQVQLFITSASVSESGSWTKTLREEEGKREKQTHREKKRHRENYKVSVRYKILRIRETYREKLKKRCRHR